MSASIHNLAVSNNLEVLTVKSQATSEKYTNIAPTRARNILIIQQNGKNLKPCFQSTFILRTVAKSCLFDLLFNQLLLSEWLVIRRKILPLAYELSDGTLYTSFFTHNTWTLDLCILVDHQCSADFRFLLFYQSGKTRATWWRPTLSPAMLPVRGKYAATFFVSVRNVARVALGEHEFASDCYPPQCVLVLPLSLGLC